MRFSSILNAARRSPAHLPAFLVVWSVSGALMLWRLGDAYLWQDEGQVAFLATTILQRGVPVAWDGRNLNNDQNYGHFFDEETFIWTKHTWGPMYLAAVGIGFGGKAAGAARTPFALFGLATIPLLFAATLQITGRPRLAWLAVIVLVINAPFYLYTRQANYYAPLLVWGVLLWWSLLRLGIGRRAWFGLALSGALLYHSNALPFFGMYAALGVTLAVCGGGWKQWLDFGKATALTVALTLPFFAWAGTAAAADDLSLRVPGSLAYNLFLFRSLTELGLAVLPWLLFPIGILWSGSKTAAAAETWAAQPLRVAGAICVAFLTIFPLYSPWAFQRYYCVIFPMGYLLTAAAIDAVWRWRRLLGLGVLGLHVCTSSAFACTAVPLWAWATLRAEAVPQYGVLLSGTREGLGGLLRMSDMTRYLGEISHDFTGPVEALVRYLSIHADREDLVLISYPRDSIAFYTDLRLCNRVNPGDPIARRLPSYVSNVEWPDWVIHRQQYPNTVFDYERFLEEKSPYYERIQLEVVDTTWENRPLPHVHRYRTATEGPRLIVWRRKPEAPLDPWHLAHARVLDD